MLRKGAFLLGTSAEWESGYALTPSRMVLRSGHRRQPRLQQHGERLQPPGVGHELPGHGIVPCHERQRDRRGQRISILANDGGTAITGVARGGSSNSVSIASYGVLCTAS